MMEMRDCSKAYDEVEFMAPVFAGDYIGRLSVRSYLLETHTPEKWYSRHVK